MIKTNIEFRKLKIKPNQYGNILKDVYYIIENGRSQVKEAFNDLCDDEKDEVKSLITKMATVENFQSLKIRYHLKKYDFGEIKPLPHRFFFFQKYGNNIIFFAYEIKKKDSLGDSIYKRLNKEKERYEKEFEKYIQGNR